MAESDGLGGGRERASSRNIEKEHSARNGRVREHILIGPYSDAMITILTILENGGTGGRKIKFSGALEWFAVIKIMYCDLI